MNEQSRSDLKLEGVPSFWHEVFIPMAGGAPVGVKLEFVGRGFVELEAFTQSMRDTVRDLNEPQELVEHWTDCVLDCVIGWNVAANFSRETVFKMLNNYPQAFRVIMDGYFAELNNARLKN